MIMTKNTVYKLCLFCRVFIWEKLDWERAEVKDSSNTRTKPLWTLDQVRLLQKANIYFFRKMTRKD